MALDRSYLEYPRRRYGMDHDRYDWSMLTDRSPVQWPGGKRLALWVNVALQFFPLNQQGKPFPPTGGMTTAYPDLRHYTLREYGNRVGIYRFLQAFDRFGVRPTFSVSARLAERYPCLLRRLAARGDEIACHGWHMDATHYGGLDPAAEEALIERSLRTLRSLTGQPVQGWLSPSRSQSANTPDLLAKQGVRYLCDWVNDDMPYGFRTGAGPMVAMPLSLELEDAFIIHGNLHSEKEYAEQVRDAFDFLYAEAAEQGGRMLALSLHPWVLGQPHRIGRLEEVLEYITAHEGVWCAPAGEICAAWQSAAR
ncbi:MAG: polysaccharide deacetylase family protein [Steroidobacteraceae bacterium]|jgi:peptidoglycan/xylan/chitin deacetylase (PgdA/CDA1 family)|nr:polysaccharide deacetylase family protein [Steroidobacteraceae bacterium]